MGGGVERVRMLNFFGPSEKASLPSLLSTKPASVRAEILDDVGAAGAGFVSRSAASAEHRRTDADQREQTPSGVTANATALSRTIGQIERIRIKVRHARLRGIEHVQLAQCRRSGGLDNNVEMLAVVGNRLRDNLGGRVREVIVA